MIMLCSVIEVELTYNHIYVLITILILHCTGHTSVVQLLIEYQADMNKQEKKRCYTALMWAVVEGMRTTINPYTGFNFEFVCICFML